MLEGGRRKKKYKVKTVECFYEMCAAEDPEVDDELVRCFFGVAFDDDDDDDDDLDDDGDNEME